MFKNPLVWITGLAVIVLCVWFALLGGPRIGGEYQTLFQNFSAGLSIGDPGSSAAPKATKIVFEKIGTCVAKFSGTSLAATSTGQFFCTGITGVKSGDFVRIILPAAARTASNSWISPVGNGYATTTDTIGFDLANWTGAATTSFAQATGTVGYSVIRTSTNP